MWDKDAVAAASFDDEEEEPGGPTFLQRLVQRAGYIARDCDDDDDYGYDF